MTVVRYTVFNDLESLIQVTLCNLRVEFAILDEIGYKSRKLKLTHFDIQSLKIHESIIEALPNFHDKSINRFYAVPELINIFDFRELIYVKHMLRLSVES